MKDSRIESVQSTGAKSISCKKPALSAGDNGFFRDKSLAFVIPKITGMVFLTKKDNWLENQSPVT